MYDEWVYYSTLVDGYVEKYSMRGMRERNGKLLKALKQQDGSPEARKTRESLIENNLPFAKYVAERYGNRRGWSKEKREDAYQDCCYAITKLLYGELTDEDIRYFSRRLFAVMTNHLNCIHKSKTTENLAEFTVFDEEDFPQQITPEIMSFDKKALDLLWMELPSRSAEILKKFYWGDPDNYIEPMVIEDLSFHYGLSSARVSAIKEKALKTLSKEIPARLAQPHCLYTMDDYFID